LSKNKSKLTSQVNQRANYKQLTLFDQGLTTLFVYLKSSREICHSNGWVWYYRKRLHKFKNNHNL